MGATLKTPEFAEEFYDMQVELGQVKKEAAAKNIGLKEIHALSDRVFYLCERMENIQQVAGRALASSEILFQGHKIIDTLEDRKKKIWDKDHRLLKKIHLIDYEIETLRDEILFVTEDETKAKLDAFFEELKHLQGENVPTPRLEKAFGIVLDHLREVDFCIQFPIYQELLADSYQENYIQKLQGLALDFQVNPEKALLEFLLLSDRQRKEIAIQIMKRKGITGDAVAAGPDDRAIAIQDHVQELVAIATFAKEIFYEDREDPLEVLDKLSNDDAVRVNELFWQKTGRTTEHFQDEDFSLLAACLMQLVEEKIME